MYNTSNLHIHSYLGSEGHVNLNNAGHEINKTPEHQEA